MWGDVGIYVATMGGPPMVDAIKGGTSVQVVPTASQHPFYMFKWVIGTVGKPKYDAGNSGTRIFVSTVNGDGQSRGVRPLAPGDWPELNRTFDFTGARGSFDCSTSSSNRIYCNIRYPNLFKYTASTGATGTPTKLNIKSALTTFVKNPWQWKIPGGLVSFRGPPCEHPANGYNNAEAWGSLVSHDYTDEPTDNWSCMFYSADYVRTGGEYWCNRAWLERFHCSGYQWKWGLCESNRDFTANMPNGVWTTPLYDCVTWERLETVIALSDANRNWSQWGAKSTNGYGVKECLSNDIGSNIPASYPDALKLGSTVPYTCKTGAWGGDGNNSGFWCPESHYAFTFLKDIYNALDGIEAPSGYYKITRGADKFPGALRLTIFLSLKTSLIFDRTVPTNVKLTSSMPVDSLSQSIVRQFLNANTAYSNAVVSDDETYFSYTVSTYSDPEDKLDQIAGLLYLFTQQFTIPVDFSKLPTEVGGYSDLALSWKISLAFLNGGVVAETPEMLLPFYQIVSSTSFSNTTTWHDLRWTAQAGTNLSNSQQSTTFCNAVSGGLTAQVGSQSGTCAQTALSAYTSNTSAIYTELTNFNNQYEIATSISDEVLTSISDVVTKIKGSRVVYMTALSDSQRRVIDDLDTRLRSLPQMFRSANNAIQMVTNGILTSTGDSGTDIASQVCNTKTTVSLIQAVNNSIQAAYRSITTMFEGFKTAFSDLAIDVGTNHNLPDIQEAITSIQDKLNSLAANIEPMRTSAGLLDPTKNSGLPAVENPPATSSTPIVTSASKPNFGMYIGIAVGVLLVGFLVYYFYIRTPTPVVVK